MRPKADPECRGGGGGGTEGAVLGPKADPE